MPYNPDNVFAAILRGAIPCQKIFENEHVVAFHDIHPQAPVHVLVIPKGAYTGPDDFATRASEAEIVAFTRAIGTLARQLGVEATGYRLLANEGPHAHQEVPHFHVHLLAGRPLGPLLTPASA